MEEQNQNWKDVIYEQVSEKENKPKKNKSKKMKHMKLVVGAAIAAGVLVPAVFGSFYQIQEQEQAVLVTFGKPKAVTETGLHFKLPFIQEVRKVNTTIQGFPVGYTEENNEMVEAESIMITSDYNFIDVDFFVEYRISDPVAYLYGSREPEQILRNISQSCMWRMTSTSPATVEIRAAWSSTPALPALSVWQTVCWLPPINPPY